MIDRVETMIDRVETRVDGGEPFAVGTNCLNQMHVLHANTVDLHLELVADPLKIVVCDGHGANFLCLCRWRKERTFDRCTNLQSGTDTGCGCSYR